MKIEGSLLLMALTTLGWYLNEDKEKWKRNSDITKRDSEMIVTIADLIRTLGKIDIDKYRRSSGRYITMEIYWNDHV